MLHVNDGPWVSSVSAKDGGNCLGSRVAGGLEPSFMTSQLPACDCVVAFSLVQGPWKVFESGGQIM